MDFLIKPLEQVGELKLGESMEIIHSLFKYSFSESIESNEYIKEKWVNEHYDNVGIILGYPFRDKKLAYVIITSSEKALFEGKDLLSLKYRECFNFIKHFDNELVEEDDVGFSSFKLGLSIYCPNGFDNPKSKIECINISVKGYLENEKGI